MEILQKNDLIRSILSMPPLDRIEIVDKVMEGFNSNLDNDFEILWAEESERRIDGYLNGSIKAVPIDEVFKKINNLK
jgi:putative addiction module component (TIGR02574 family)